MTKTSKPSLAETHPELAAQAHGWAPDLVWAGSYKKMSWKCTSGHIWEASISNRSRNGTGCPVCLNRKVLIGLNDLATTHPELAKEADGWDPTSVTAGSHEKVSWKCHLEHTWVAQVKSRSKVGSGCPVCSNRKVHLGFNDLATTHPELAKEADGWDPTSVTAGSHEKVSWKCQLGHTWMTEIVVRKSGFKCPFCSNYKVHLGFNDLATTHPELAKEADGWDPTSVIAGSKQKVSWKCQLGHTWMATLNNRTSSESACPICSNKKVVIGFNDLATTNPELALEADGWDPKLVTFGSGKKLNWKCNLGHQWKAMVASRSLGMGCPICSHKKLLGGFNDLATTHPELAKEADGWDPTSVIAGSKQKVSWKCQLGHTWMAQLNSRRQGRGCPSCSQTGFDPGKPGFLYLIDNFDLHMFQIGITNFPQNRLSRHKKSGWQILELRGPMKGRLTQQLETDCLHALEKRGAVLGHKAGIEKFDGYSEAWTKASLNVSSIKQILDWVYEDESK